MLHQIFVLHLITLIRSLYDLGIRYKLRFVNGMALVTMARNTLANELLESDGTHLLMLDCDQAFESSDIVKMIRAEKEVIALPTTLKRLNWERIAEAAKRGVNPQQLKHFGGMQNFNDLPNASYSIGATAVEVNKVGAAIMLMKRSAFEKLEATHPEWKVKRWHDFEGANQREFAINFFQTSVDDKTGFIQTEDFFFCTECRKVGIPIHIIPGAVTQHMGSLILRGMPARSRNSTCV